MNAYLFPFQSDENIILLPYKKKLKKVQKTQKSNYNNYILPQSEININ